MTLDTSDRREIIRKLLELSWPLEDIAAKVRAIEWDSEGEPVPLTRKHLAAVLRRYLECHLSAKDVETWANLIEGRDDICFEAGSEDRIKETLHELANPALTQLLDNRRAAELHDAITYSEHLNRN